MATAVLIGFTAFPQAPSGSQIPSPSQPAQNADQQTESANALVKATVQNELKTIDHTHWMYLSETHKAGATETKEIVETPHGNLTRLVAHNGQPLNPDEQKREDQKVQKFVNDTGAQEKLRHNLDQDEKIAKNLFAMLPDALTYTYVGREGNHTKLTFKPNPGFHPPSCEAGVFRAMEGEMVIDTKEHWLVEFSGHLTHPVKFGGGLLGDLDAGGSFDVRQQEVGPGHWEISLLKVNVKGKALVFRTVSVQLDERHRDFKRVPDGLTLAQAGDLAKKLQASPANLQSGG
ncbi:MAG TPA: hypothetical protein VFW30_05275 [Bryocella sp.]|nr:hypothetical protein [Bryocella sp.]